MSEVRLLRTLNISDSLRSVGIVSMSSKNVGDMGGVTDMTGSGAGLTVRTTVTTLLDGLVGKEVFTFEKIFLRRRGKLQCDKGIEDRVSSKI